MTQFTSYTGAILTHTAGNLIRIETQLKATYEPTPFQLKLREGFAFDNHLYLHQAIDKVTGEVKEQYVGPLDL